jgi:hypothetical protein
MNEIENTPSLMNKKADDMTVADSLKLTALVMAAFVAIPVVTAAGAAAFQSFANWRSARKFEKAILETTAQEV